MDIDIVVSSHIKMICPPMVRIIIEEISRERWIEFRIRLGNFDLSYHPHLHVSLS